MNRLIKYSIVIILLFSIVCIKVALSKPIYEELSSEVTAEMFGGATVCSGYKCNGFIVCTTRCDSSECSSATKLTSQHDCGLLNRSIYSSGSSYKVCTQSNVPFDKCTPAAGNVARCYYKSMTCEFYLLSYEFKTGTCNSYISNIENILQGSYDCQ